MNAQDRERFWLLYAREAQPAIERACRAASKSLSDGTMDPDDMISWAHQRVWKMLETSAWPTFHDEPSPEVACARLTANARVVARWAYLSLMRKHWRRTARQNAFQGGLSRAERLAMVSRVDDEGSRDEAIREKLDHVKANVSAQLRAKLAASWPEESERRRIALALGATSDADEALMNRTCSGTMKENTIQQMRSRAQRQIRTILGSIKRSAAIALAAGAVMLASVPSVAAHRADYPGEQTGGRGGKDGRDSGVRDGEQTGGRRGARTEAPTHSGEQGGGRRGHDDGERSGGR